VGTSAYPQKTQETFYGFLSRPSRHLRALRVRVSAFGVHHEIE
jgi:hypothetical protein